MFSPGFLKQFVGNNPHSTHRYQDRLNTLDWGPSLLCCFVTVLVFPGRVQDADAHTTIRINVWVPHDRLKCHHRWLEGKFWWKLQAGSKAPTCKEDDTTYGVCPLILRGPSYGVSFGPRIQTLQCDKLSLINCGNGIGKLRLWGAILQLRSQQLVSLSKL